MIQIKDVTKLYPAKAAGNENGKDAQSTAIHALDHISLHVATGRMAFHHGPVGIGQIHAGEFDRVPGSAIFWRDLARRSECGGHFSAAN